MQIYYFCETQIINTIEMKNIVNFSRNNNRNGLIFTFPVSLTCTSQENDQTGIHADFRSRMP